MIIQYTQKHINNIHLQSRQNIYIYIYLLILSTKSYFVLTCTQHSNTADSSWFSSGSQTPDGWLPWLAVAETRRQFSRLNTTSFCPTGPLYLCSEDHIRTGHIHSYLIL